MSALHRFLVEFDLDRPGLPRGAWPLLGRDPEPAADEDAADDLPALSPPEPEVDGVAEAVAAAVAAALAEAEADKAAALAALAALHAVDLEEARARWTAEEAAPLAEGFRQGLAALEDALAEAAGAALEPLIGEASRIAAIADLSRAVADLVTNGTGGRIAVRGAPDLVVALESALAAAGVDTAAIDFTPCEAVEVVVTADNSGIETRLDAWVQALRHRLGEP